MEKARAEVALADKAVNEASQLAVQDTVIFADVEVLVQALRLQPQQQTLDPVAREALARMTDALTSMTAMQQVQQQGPTPITPMAPTVTQGTEPFQELQVTQEALLRTEEVCIQMDKDAQKDFTYRMTQEEYFRCRKNWWISLNKSGKIGPVRDRSDFYEASTKLHRLHQESGEEQLRPVPVPSFHKTSDVPTFKMFFKFVAVRSFTTDSSLLQPTGGVNTTPHTTNVHSELHAYIHTHGSSLSPHSFTCHPSSWFVRIVCFSDCLEIRPGGQRQTCSQLKAGKVRLDGGRQARMRGEHRRPKLIPEKWRGKNRRWRVTPECTNAWSAMPVADSERQMRLL